MIKRRQLILTIVLLAAAPALFAQSDAIAALRSRLLGGGPNCVIKIDGLHAATDFLNRPVEVHIVNGLISKGIILRGKVDIPFPAGQHVQVIRVEAVGNNKSDALRLLLGARNAALSISFEVERGTLTKMTEQQLTALIDPVLFFPGGPATGDPSAMSRRPPPQPNPATMPPVEKPLQPLIPSEAVQSIQVLLQKNRQITLRPEGLHGAMGSPDLTRDNRILNGALELRTGAETRYGGRDVRFPNGQPVEVVNLTPLTSDQNDVLRLIVRAPTGAFIPIAFVLPKDSLAAMSMQQIHQTMSAAVAMPPLIPPHPANTVVDLKPAAPGFGPMHASENALGGCWYVPYLSKKWDLEAAILNCETSAWNTKASDTEKGIAFEIGGTPPVEILTVHTKRAEQTIEAAIKQQFIVKKLQIGCRAQCKTEQDGLVNCEVVAFGTYAKQKRFQSKGEKGDAEEPCPGPASDDVSGRFFIYRPAESKTKFLFFTTEDLLTVNLATIHFLPEL